jgi:hypothetical protein
VLPAPARGRAGLALACLEQGVCARGLAPPYLGCWCDLGGLSDQRHRTVNFEKRRLGQAFRRAAAFCQVKVSIEGVRGILFNTSGDGLARRLVGVLRGAHRRLSPVAALRLRARQAGAVAPRATRAHPCQIVRSAAHVRQRAARGRHNPRPGVRPGDGDCRLGLLVLNPSRIASTAHTRVLLRPRRPAHRSLRPRPPSATGASVPALMSRRAALARRMAADASASIACGLPRAVVCTTCNALLLLQPPAAGGAAGAGPQEQNCPPPPYPPTTA